MHPRVLVVSHNCFSVNSNMGKTLASYFAEWDSSALAQLYFHSELPNIDLCRNYFRIKDTDAMRSVLRRNSCGKVVSSSEFLPSSSKTRTDTGILARVYQFGEKRTAAIYTARNFLWACSAWNSAALQKWLDDFAPQAVFFASGDYSFAYKIALHIARQRNIPLILCCVDDYYLHNANSKTLLGCWQHARFMKWVKKTADYAGCIMTISQKMTDAYAKMFRKPSFTLHTGYAGANAVSTCSSEKHQLAVSYLGNLGYLRGQQLAQIGRILKKLALPGLPQVLDVYSGETNPEKLKDLTPENGVRFHGAVPATDVPKIMAESLAIVHAESFQEDMRQRVRFSVSTKIAESLASGTCLIAYGPPDIASIEYLAENNAACVITDPEQLEESLKKVLTDETYRQMIVKNALILAEKNHRPDSVCRLVYQTIEDLCK